MAGGKRVMSELYISQVLCSLVLRVEMELENCYLSKIIASFLTLLAVILYSTQSMASPKYETFSVSHSKKTAVY